MRGSGSILSCHDMRLIAVRLHAIESRGSLKQRVLSVVGRDARIMKGDVRPLFRRTCMTC
eukprot:9331793-Pyramimonas_sp.AAC.1